MRVCIQKGQKATSQSLQVIILTAAWLKVLCEYILLYNSFSCKKDLILFVNLPLWVKYPSIWVYPKCTILDNNIMKALRFPIFKKCIWFPHLLIKKKYLRKVYRFAVILSRFSCFCHSAHGKLKKKKKILIKSFNAA